MASEPRRIARALLFLAAVTTFAGAAAAQGVLFTEAPRDLQLYCRDARDSAQVVFSGLVTESGHDSVRLEVLRGGQPWRSVTAALAYGGGTAPFHLSATIHSELAEYSARFYLDHSLIAHPDNLVCGDAYLICGQSNAVATDYQGGALGHSEWYRSFGSIADVAGADSTWGFAQARTGVTHCWVGVWGLVLGLSLVETEYVPIAFLNGGENGSEILQHLRDESDPYYLNTIYGRLLWRAEKCGIRHGVRAMFWHQGESDTYDQWSQYLDRFTTLRSAWLEDYEGIEKIYVFQIHQGCGGGAQAELREVQRTLPQIFPDLEVMSTMGLNGHDGCHYGYNGYAQMARWIYGLAARDLYGATDTWNIEPPNVQAAWFATEERHEVRVRFQAPVVWPADTLGMSMRDYFYVTGGGENVRVTSGRVLEDGETLALTLARPANIADRLSYLPECCDLAFRTYEGPWIRNPRGIGALSFWEFPIGSPSDVAGPGAPPVSPGVGVAAAELRLLEVSPNPSTGSVAIRFRTRVGGPARLEIFDAAGGRVSRGEERSFQAGEHVIRWNGMDRSGRPAPPGLYLYRLGAGGTAREGRLVRVAASNR